MNERPTPETDACISSTRGKSIFDLCKRFERERDEALAAIVGWENKWKCAVEMAAQAEVEGDEARERAAKWESSFDAMERAGAEQARRADENREWALRAERERDEAREEIKELIYIAERAIALAEIDFENDKFGVVSELRENLEKIKEAAK